MSQLLIDKKGLSLTNICILTEPNSLPPIFFFIRVLNRPIHPHDPAKPQSKLQCSRDDKAVRHCLYTLSVGFKRVPILLTEMWSLLKIWSFCPDSAIYTSISDLSSSTTEQILLKSLEHMVNITFISSEIKILVFSGKSRETSGTKLSTASSPLFLRSAKKGQSACIDGYVIAQKTSV